MLTVCRFHAETRILTTLFALLMWDIMFADILGAFETPYQTAPLDLHEETFYLARKGLIETRLEDIKDIDKAKAILAKHDDKYRPHNVFCCGVRWDLCPKEDLLEIIAVILGAIPVNKCITDAVISSALEETLFRKFAVSSAKIMPEDAVASRT